MRFFTRRHVVVPYGRTSIGLGVVCIRCGERQGSYLGGLPEWPHKERRDKDNPCSGTPANDEAKLRVTNALLGLNVPPPDLIVSRSPTANRVRMSRRL